MQLGLSTAAFYGRWETEDAAKRIEELFGASVGSGNVRQGQIHKVEIDRQGCCVKVYAFFETPVLRQQLHEFELQAAQGLGLGKVCLLPM